MRETDLLRLTPNFVPTSNMQESREMLTLVKCPMLNEIQIRNDRQNTLYRIIPQMNLSNQLVKVALSFIENGQLVASRTQELSRDKNYSIENTRIKISLTKFKGDEEFYIMVEAPGFKVIKEAQPLSTRKYY